MTQERSFARLLALNAFRLADRIIVPSSAPSRKGMGGWWMRMLFTKEPMENMGILKYWLLLWSFMVRQPSSRQRQKGAKHEV